MGKSILNALVVMILTCMTAFSQQDNKAIVETAIDTIELEDVTIGVLPFQESYQEAGKTSVPDHLALEPDN